MKGLKGPKKIERYVYLLKLLHSMQQPLLRDVSVLKSIRLVHRDKQKPQAPINLEHTKPRNIPPPGPPAPQDPDTDLLVNFTGEINHAILCHY